MLPLRERLQDMFGKAVSPVDVFRLPTVASQARFMTATDTAAQTDKKDDEVAQLANRRRDAFRQNKNKRQTHA